MDIGPPEIIILLVLLLVVFGGSQVPKLARNLGKAQSEFKKGLQDGKDALSGDAPATPAADAPATIETPTTIETPASTDTQPADAQRDSAS